MQPLSQLRGKLWRQPVLQKFNSKTYQQGICDILYCCCFLVVLCLCLNETICIDSLFIDPTVKIVRQNVHSSSNVPPVPELLTFAEDGLEPYLQRDLENKHVVIAINFMDFYEVIQASEKASTGVRSLRTQLGM